MTLAESSIWFDGIVANYGCAETGTANPNAARNDGRVPRENQVRRTGPSWVIAISDLKGECAGASAAANGARSRWSQQPAFRASSGVRVTARAVFVAGWLHSAVGGLLAAIGGFVAEKLVHAVLHTWQGRADLALVGS